MPANIFRKRRRLQKWPPAFINVCIYICFGANEIAPVFFIPTTYKSIKQSNSRKRICSGRLHYVFVCLEATAAIFIQCPPGEIFFEAKYKCPCVFRSKGLQSQKLAISFSSFDR